VVVVRATGDSCAIRGLADTPTFFGATVPGLPEDFTELDRLASAVGTTPDVVMWYAAWHHDGDFPAAAARRVAELGAVPQVTWEPWDPAAGALQQTYPLELIASGEFDDYIIRWARQARAYGGPVMMRFAHEMNADFYPWSEVGGRNPEGSYVDAWRHVHDVFSDAGADNVVWVWSPNIPYPGTTELSGLYPGDDYVDAVALDGYNWSTLQPETGWLSFDSIFAAGLEELDGLSSRPRMIGEVASAEQGGDKATWIAAMFETLQEREICGFTWFNFAKETDWRIESSPGSLEAFRAGLADSSG
jgi:hypothetical protein